MKKFILSLYFLGSLAACVIAGEFEIAWHTIDSGGAMRSTGNGFELSGTIGQPDAGSSSGGGFQLSGGFWFELPPGDCDEDGVANLMDHEFFTQCLGGPDGSVLSSCECYDVDHSGNVDLRDFATTSNGLGSP